jgi:hypothetical protein
MTIHATATAIIPSNLDRDTAAWAAILLRDAVRAVAGCSARNGVGAVFATAERLAFNWIDGRSSPADAALPPVARVWDGLMAVDALAEEDPGAVAALSLLAEIEEQRLCAMR